MRDLDSSKIKNAQERFEKIEKLKTRLIDNPEFGKFNLKLKE